jgi:hypothetical protein
MGRNLSFFKTDFNIDIDICVCMVSSFLVYIISQVAFRRIEQAAEIFNSSFPPN